jgi:hypothetical protein
LLTALQISSLKDTISVKGLLKAIDSLPAGLNALYECTFRRIETQAENKASLARKAIIWLIYAYRSLTITELQHALALSDETEKFDEDEVSPEKFIVSACCGLIVADKQSRTVRLVREYMTCRAKTADG